MNKLRLFLLFVSFSAVNLGFCQIGYQVALLDKATGEPRVNETVAVDLTISDSAGGTIYSGSQTATTNEFGMLSLAVGDTTTFSNVDWSKLPLFISATVDGTLLGRTQILSVPVAEHAKHTGTLTKEKLCSKIWTSDNSFYTWTFKLDGTFTKTEREFYNGSWHTDTYTSKYYIQGDIVILVGAFYPMLYVNECECLRRFDNVDMIR